MSQKKVSMQTARCVLTATALSLGFVGNVMAQFYDFHRLVPGGGGAGGPPGSEKFKTVVSRGQNICLEIRQGSGNEVMFTIWSMIPEPNASLQRINIDTGSNYPDLLTKLTIKLSSPEMKPVVSSPQGGFGKRFEVYLPYEYAKSGYKQPRGGLKQGNFIMMTATLGPGRTFANLMTALQVGLNPVTERSGLRLWVSGHSFLGGPPPGVATISDDATFALRGQAPQCRR